ncbi:hypothetical protein Y032_0377g269 [Ancylostoma ceylanicum]|uniref:Uncharacterized protein n=1 Tax=Ancylostoma ceylanicum TaxID=53326 RepID=A0A016RU96_9BILA|nr:hypothetical protein Y032_0377g269 [Ancylostoma ceylanicum]
MSSDSHQYLEKQEKGDDINGMCGWVTSSFLTPPNDGAAQAMDQPALVVDQPVVVKKPILRQAQSKSSASGMGVPINNEDLRLLQQAERLLKEKSAYDNDEPEAVIRVDGQDRKVAWKSIEDNKTARPMEPIQQRHYLPLQHTQGLSEKMNPIKSKMLTARCPVLLHPRKCSSNNLAAKQALQQQAATQPSPQQTPTRRLALKSFQAKPSPIQQSPLKPAASSPAVAGLSPAAAIQSPMSPARPKPQPQSPAIIKQAPQSPAVAKQVPQSPAIAKRAPQSPAVAELTPQSPAVGKRAQQYPTAATQPQSPASTRGPPKLDIAKPAPIQAGLKPRPQQQAPKPKADYTPVSQSPRQPLVKQMPQQAVVKKVPPQTEFKEEKQVLSDFIAF